MDDPFQVLGVTRDAPAEVIRAAYRALAQKHHPDRNARPAATAAMQRVNEAFAILTDPVRRASYEEAQPPAGGAGSSRKDSDPSGRQSDSSPSSPDANEFCPEPIRHTVRDVSYEILFHPGRIFDTREWVDSEQRIKHDHRLFVGRGRYLAVENVPRQRLWVRLAVGDVLLERAGDLLPVAVGHAVTLVTLRSPQSVQEGLHIALVNRDTNRWFALGKLGDAASKVMSGRAYARDALKTLGIVIAGSALVYATLLRSGTALGWVVALLVGAPLLWTLAPMMGRTTLNAVEKDIREALAAVGLQV